MLYLKDIKKIYKVGDNVTEALKGVTIEFRKSEFVAILGPSGCGKTTLLNIVGGLDNYTSGNLLINHRSTKNFTDNDWDSYRNTSVGFVFQSYNLIMHQNVLANVELALTLCGLHKAERRAKALSALEKVDLLDQIKKKPNQLSGGQMQRVAIARALINDPDIVLADEPTGALDYENSIQIMELLADVAKERLVVMVTHNPELAEKYATRIIKLSDGKVVDDSAPYTEDWEIPLEEQKGNKFKVFVKNFANWWKSDTYVPTSFEDNPQSNKKSKKKTVIKEAPIVEAPEVKQKEIYYEVSDDVAKVFGKANIADTVRVVAPKRKKVVKPVVVAEPVPVVSEEPTVEATSKKKEKRPKKTSMSLGSALRLSLSNLLTKKVRTALTAVAGSIGIIGIALVMSLSTGVGAFLKNTEESSLSQYPITIQQQNIDITSVLEILGSNNSDLDDYPDTEEIYVQKILGNVNLSTLSEILNENDLAAFKAYLDENFSDDWGSVKYNYGTTFNIYSNNIPSEEYFIINPFDEAMGKLANGAFDSLLQNAKVKEIATSFAVWEELVENQKLLNQQYDLLGDSKWPTKEDELVLVVDSKNQIADYVMFTLGLRDPNDFMKALNGEGLDEMDYSVESLIGTEYKLLANSDYYTLNEETGLYTNTAKLDVTDEFIKTNGMTLKIVGVVRPKEGVTGGAINGTIAYTSELAKYMLDRIDTSEVVTAQKASPKKNVLDGTDLSTKQYDALLEKLGVANIENPTSILIYASSFDSKETIKDMIAKYNTNADLKATSTTKSKAIKYTDTLTIIMSYVETLTTTITGVLVGFSAISLIVSSIMIGIITYTSVLERTKEIGVLRSLGARKKDVSRVFLAETTMIGALSGIIGIVFTYIMTFPTNYILEKEFGISNLAQLTWIPVVALFAISVILSNLAGLLPSKIASNKDPVTALRTE